MSPAFTLSRRDFLITTAAASTLIAAHPFKARAAAGQVHLRLIETTDLHVAIDPYDYFGDKPDDTQGLARTATLIKGIRAEAGNSILLDNGDLIQGNPLGDYIALQKGVTQEAHPMFRAMNLLGYEVATLGNHEFNYGLDFLSASLAGANFPFVCANLVNGTELGEDPTKDTTFIAPYRVIDRVLKDGAGDEHKIGIGFIGFVRQVGLGFFFQDRWTEEEMTQLSDLLYRLVAGTVANLT